MTTNFRWALRATVQFHYVSSLESFSNSPGWPLDTLFLLNLPAPLPPSFLWVTDLVSYFTEKIEAVRREQPQTPTNLLVSVSTYPVFPLVILNELPVIPLKADPLHLCTRTRPSWPNQGHCSNYFPLLWWHQQFFFHQTDISSVKKKNSSLYFSYSPIPLFFPSQQIF